MTVHFFNPGAILYLETAPSRKLIYSLHCLLKWQKILIMLQKKTIKVHLKYYNVSLGCKFFYYLLMVWKLWILILESILIRIFLWLYVCISNSTLFLYTSIYLYLEKSLSEDFPTLFGNASDWFSFCSCNDLFQPF